MNLKELLSPNIELTELAKDDLLHLDGSILGRVIKGINKVANNPKPETEGGYGKPLGNKSGNNLTGYCKVKFSSIGVRCVYQCIYDKKIGMKIIIISMRADNEVYNEASKRIDNI